MGKVNDFTVITPFDLCTFKVGKQERFNQMDWNLQKVKIQLAYSTFKPSIMTIDSTGIGNPIVDDLSKSGLNLEPFTFTEKSRMDLLMNLKLLIESKKIRIPNDPILIGELKSFEYQIGDKGKIRAGCPENLHDDCVMSLALAVWGIPNEPYKVTNFYQEVINNILNDFSIDEKTGYLK